MYTTSLPDDSVERTVALTNDGTAESQHCVIGSVAWITALLGPLNGSTH